MDIIKTALDEAAKLLRSSRKEALTAHSKLHFKIVSDNPDILGREDETDHVLRLYGDSNDPIVIHGPGGIGKTAFVDHFARANFRNTKKPRYCGAWRVSGENISKGWDDLSPLATHLGVSPTDNAEANFHATLAKMSEARGNKRWLLIHDNVDEPEAQRLLARRFQHLDAVDHLVTSRIADWGNVATTVTRTGIEPASARLKAWLQNQYRTAP